MGSLEDDFENWKKNLWTAIKTKTGEKGISAVKTKKKNELVYSITTEPIPKIVDLSLDYEF